MADQKISELTTATDSNTDLTAEVPLAYDGDNFKITLSDLKDIFGLGVPSGGTSAQVLTKASGDDYDLLWADASGGGGDTGVPRDVTSDDDMVADDFGTLSVVGADSSSTITLTVPSGLSVSEGQKAVIYQKGSGQLVIAAGTGVTINTPETLNAAKQYASLVLTCTGTDEYLLGGYMENSS